MCTPCMPASSKNQYRVTKWLRGKAMQHARYKEACRVLHGSTHQGSASCPKACEQSR